MRYTKQIGLRRLFQMLIFFVKMSCICRRTPFFSLKGATLLHVTWEAPLRGSGGNDGRITKFNKNHFYANI